MKSNYIFSALTCLLLLASCQKVVDINLNSASPQIVIEGTIADVSGWCSVKISRTVNFSDTNDFPPVTGALVTISDDSGNLYTIEETSPGLYYSDHLRGLPGRTYTLRVATDGKEYTAVSTLPDPVAIDTLTIAQRAAGLAGRKIREYINVQFNDPATIENYYRFQETINEDLQTGIILDDDRLHDGEAITRALYYGDNNDLIPGDVVTVYLESIDANVYHYFRTLNQLENNGTFSAAPANPVTNLNNGAQGYFSAFAVASKMIIIK